LQNIMNGVHAQGSVNVDRARAIGSGILDSMTGDLAADFKFKIANQAITLGVKSSVHISGEQVQVDPQLLFQRSVTACKSQEEMESNFQFELCSYPPALLTHHSCSESLKNQYLLMLFRQNSPRILLTIWIPCTQCSMS